MLHIVGETLTQDINIKLNSEQTITAVNCMKLIASGHDEDFKRELAKLPKVARECVDAVCWEAEDTVEKFIALLEGDGRFAVCHNDIEFGMASTHKQALAAWVKEEF